LFYKCLADCRTSKKTIIHGNRYKSVFKHCFEDRNRTLKFGNLDGAKWIVAENSGENCDFACLRHGQVCVPQYLNQVTCQNMKELLTCSSCAYESRLDRPSLDFLSHRKIGGKFMGKCMLPSKDAEMDCDASHPSSIRVCACVMKPNL
jgi:hypothetical protein